MQTDEINSKRILFPHGLTSFFLQFSLGGFLLGVFVVLFGWWNFWVSSTINSLIEIYTSHPTKEQIALFVNYWLDFGWDFRRQLRSGWFWPFWGIWKFLSVLSSGVAVTLVSHYPDYPVTWMLHTPFPPLKVPESECYCAQLHCKLNTSRCIPFPPQSASHSITRAVSKVSYLSLHTFDSKVLELLLLCLLVQLLAIFLVTPLLVIV